MIVIDYTLPEGKQGGGKTHHNHAGIDVTPLVWRIQISTFEGDAGAYIFYFDKEGNELNDLYYDSMDMAKRHVLWEFGLEEIQ